jgi:archaellin
VSQARGEKVHRHRRIGPDRHAVAGPGNLILLIAALLVASLVAATIIQTVDRARLQDAHAAGDARDRLAHSLQVESAAGRRPNASTPLTALDLYAFLPSGAPTLDLHQLRIELHDTDTLTVLEYVDGPASDEEFNASIVRDMDPLFDSGDGFVNAGDSVQLTLNLTATGTTLSPRGYLDVRLLPLVGEPSRTRLYSPAAFGTSLTVELF